MNNLNIPNYRAKKIGSDEYVIGNYIKVHNKFYIYEDGTSDIYLEDEECFDDGSIDGEIRIIDLIFEIDSTTLSIHFPDTDIKELFFGLGNGKGASIIEALFIEDNTPLKGVAIHTHYGYVFYDKNDDWVHITKLKDIKVIGIQK